MLLVTSTASPVTDCGIVHEPGLQLCHNLEYLSVDG
jgi:hypothetical protein